MPDRTSILLLVVVALAACGGPDRTASEAYAAYLAAFESGDAEAAYALLDEAADAGHLGALREQIEVHERGYLDPPGTSGDARRLPVTAFPWHAWGLHRAYNRALRDSAAAGSPTALLHVAHRLAGDLITTPDGAMETEMDPADRDSVAALVRRLDPTDVPRFQLALLSWHLGEEDAARAYLDAAVAAAEPNACSFRLMLTDGYATGPDVAGYAAFLDRAEACPLPPGGEGVADGGLRRLAAERDLGNPASVALLDSLRATGVFERHPRLETLVAG